MNWRVILAIARKDIVDSIKNLYILFSLVLPIGLSVLLRLFLVGPEEPGVLTIAVYDPAGSRLVAGLREQPQVRLLEVASDQQLPEEVKRKAVGGLLVPAGLDAAVDAGRQPELTVYVNGRRGGGERAAFQQMVERQIWALIGRDLPVRIASIDVAARGQVGGEFSIESYLLILLLVMALAGTGAFVVPTLLVEEKEKHTLEVLLVSPASPADVAAGKAITGLVYSLLIAGILLALNPNWVGNWPVTVLAIMLGALFMVTTGLLVGGLFHTTMQVNTWSSIIMLTLMAPSWFTLPSLPSVAEIIFRLIPTYYLTEALQLSLADKIAPAQVWANLAILAGSVALVFTAVVWTLRREAR